MNDRERETIGFDYRLILESNWIAFPCVELFGERGSQNFIETPVNITIVHASCKKILFENI